MAYTPGGRTAPRAQRAYSIRSDTPYTPNTTPPPTTRRTGAATRAVRANTIDSDAPTPTPLSVQATRLPDHYSLLPTVPSPFTGSLEASLDAILDWGSRYSVTQRVVDALLKAVESSTNWPNLLRALYLDGEVNGHSRLVLEEFLFLVTRTLMPEQIAENRALMARLYDRRKQLAIRLVLRYDMLREWKMDQTWHPMAVPSVAPTGSEETDSIPVVSAQRAESGRRLLMPNIISTLIVAPPGGWTTHAVRERMKHHVTSLDMYLLLSDAMVASWSDRTVLSMASQIVLQWQRLRQNNEILEEMEAHGYEDLEGRADECEWIADDVKKGNWGKAVGKCRTANAVGEEE